MQKRPTPTGISILEIWQIMIGSLSLVISTLLVLLSFDQNVYYSFTPYEILLWTLSLTWLFSGFGMTREKKWAWTVGLVTAVLSLVSLPLLLFTVFGLIMAPGIVIWPFAIFYLTRPRIKNLMTQRNNTKFATPSSTSAG